MEIDQHIGLRDRKRMETRARLEDAAVTLVLRDGLEHTTVDAISELADVSPRTFFNYFDSKDSAILGLRQIDFSEDMMTDHLARHEERHLVESVVHLLLTVMDTPMVRSSIREDRLEIVHRHPQLLGSQLTQMTQMASQLTEAVQALLKRESRFEGQGPADLAASADLVLALCGGAVRAAMKEWSEAGGDTDEIEQRAISLVREVIEKLT